MYIMLCAFFGQTVLKRFFDADSCTFMTMHRAMPARMKLVTVKSNHCIDIHSIGCVIHANV